MQEHKRPDYTTPSMLLFQVIVIGILFIFSTSLFDDALERRQAKRLHDRLAGIPPEETVLDDMEAQLMAGNALDAAMIAIEHEAFYNVTLKNFAAPWTNREQNVFTPLNDYTATVIGMSSM